MKKFLFAAAGLFAISGSCYSQWSTSGNNIYYNSGNVGIGTSSPSVSLQVNNQSLFKNKVHIGGSTYVTPATSPHTEYFEVNFQSEFGGPAYFHHTVGLNSTTFHNGYSEFNASANFNDDVIFNDLSSFNDHCSFMGSVSIGATTTTYDFEVNGNSKFTGSSEFVGSLELDGSLSLTTSNGTYNSLITGNISGSNFYSPTLKLFSAYHNQELLLDPSKWYYTVSSDEYVFISNAKFKPTSASADYISIVADNTDNYIKLSKGANSLLLDPNELKYDSGNDKYVFNTSGEFRSASFKIIKPSGSFPVMFDLNTTSSTLDVNVSTLWLKGAINGQGLQFDQVNKKVNAKDFEFNVYQNGTKTIRLRTTGQIDCREVNVTLSNLGDFVFEDDYSMLSLPELEGYVKQHKHLPGLPTCDQVAEQGLNVGEVTNDLLIKIEELTLYVIDLQKQIDVLNQQTANQ